MHIDADTEAGEINVCRRSCWSCRSCRSCLAGNARSACVSTRTLRRWEQGVAGEAAGEAEHEGQEDDDGEGSEAESAGGPSLGRCRCRLSAAACKWAWIGCQSYWPPISRSKGPEPQTHRSTDRQLDPAT